MDKNNPIIPLIPNPVGLDAKIQKLQIAIGAGLPWLAHSFGRATPAYIKGPGAGDAVQVRPQVYMGGNRYAPVEPNDRWAGHSFIQATQPERPVDYQKFQANTYATQVELVVLFNLTLIEQEMAYGYSHRFVEEVKQQIKMVLRRLPEFEVVAVYDSPREVLAGYTYDGHAHQTFRHPEGGYKFVLNVAYVELC